MRSTTHAFSDNARRALHDATLQQALAKAGIGFVDKRRVAIAELPDHLTSAYRLGQEVAAQRRIRGTRAP